MSALRNLYVHVPFCDGKCGYCGFYSEVAEDEVRAGYARLPAFELSLLKRARLRPVTIYVGGGTPGMLGADGLAELAHALRACLDLGTLEEWSVELNPANISLALIAALRQAGINRVSVGVQSLEDAVLRRLGRRHDAAAAEQGVRMLLHEGFANTGVDLLAGTPDTSMAQWRKTLEGVVALGVAHVSVYALTVEPGTPLAREVAAGLKLPDEDFQAEALREAEGLLTAAGFERYEISNYARPGYACRHNLACWRGDDFLGLGPGASSRVGRRRWTNLPDLARYTAALTAGRTPPRASERMNACDDASGRFAFGLRLAEGVSPRAFARRSKAAARAVEWDRTLERYAGHGIVERCDVPGMDRRWRLTARGREVADTVIRELL
ncbi:MAG: radical SAM family heme chaperone HemW [Kiritimatiellae bacterium]|nr:radical SAM family heme chaperone HemW [Kiritimatiellia bacterium]